MATYTVEKDRAILTGKGVRAITIGRQVLYNLIELNADSLGDELKEALEEAHDLAAKGDAALVIIVEQEETPRAA
jgi:hypothetical protein